MSNNNTYCVYFIFGENNIQDFIYMGIGNEDFAYSHQQGKIDETRCPIENLFQIKRNLKLDEIKQRVAIGENLDLYIFRQNLKLNVATSIRKLLSLFEFKFSKFSLIHKESRISCFENTFFSKLDNRIENANMAPPNGFYNYLLVSKSHPFVLFHKGIGTTDFAINHARNKITIDELRKFELIEDYDIGFEYDNIEVVYLTQDLSFKQATFFKNVMIDLYRFFCQDHIYLNLIKSDDHVFLFE